MKYKIIARPEKGSGFTHGIYDNLEDATRVLEEYKNDPDLILRKWEFWIHEEK